MPEFLVLDSFALLAYYQKEASGAVVERVLQKVAKKKATGLVSEMSVGEIYYMAWKKQGKDKADQVLANLWALPLNFITCRREEILAAAALKAQNSNISYADCFVLSLALTQKAVIVTGDPEFKKFAKEAKLIWLGA